PHPSLHPLAPHPSPTRRSSDLHPHCSRRQREECSPRTAGGEFGEMCRYRRGSRPQSTVGEGSVLVAEGRRCWVGGNVVFHSRGQDRKSTRLNSSHVSISYAVFC